MRLMAVAVLLAALMVAGCGGGAKQEANPAASDSAALVEPSLDSTVSPDTTMEVR